LPLLLTLRTFLLQSLTCLPALIMMSIQERLDKQGGSFSPPSNVSFLHF
jgi:hypothetical protein